MADPHEKQHVDELTGIGTTGHEWDGIRELDNPLPRWWLIIFYASIAISIVYWVLMPAWPLVTSHTRGILNYTDRAQVASDISALKATRGPNFDLLQSADLSNLDQSSELFRFAQAAGASAFGDNCATCHGSGAQGFKGYPSLQDDVWIWGGALSDIEHTLQVGIRADHPETRYSQMPAYGRDEILPAATIDDVTEYVIQISGGAPRSVDMAARGAITYAEQCAVCHAADGGGDRSQGAPSLKDQVWLYGGTREEIRTQIWEGRGGVMPAWSGRLDEGTIRALAIYVHSLGGGEAEPPPPAPVAPIEAQPTSLALP